MSLNPMMQAYAEAIVRGLNQTQAALDAGYSEKSAKQKGSLLGKDVKVRAEIARLREQKYKPAEEKKDGKFEFEDPIEFMKTMANDFREDPKLRLDAAKAWASYTVQKPGEKGKKGEAEDKAKKAQSRFTPAAAPLRAVK